MKNELKYGQLIENANRLYNYAGIDEYIEWFDSLKPMEQKKLFASGLGLTDSNLNKLSRIKYLPDAYYVVRYNSGSTNLLMVKNNYVYCFDFGWIGSVSSLFNQKKIKRIILRRFEMNYLLEKFRILK